MFAHDIKFFFDFLISFDVYCHIHISYLMYLKSVPYPFPTYYLWYIASLYL